MTRDSLETLAARSGQCLKERGMRLATAESCTGGWVSMAVTAVPGSSDWFERGFVSYSNDAKREMLGVRGETLIAQGAVSEAVAREMAEGALRQSRADVSIAVTGIAGPAGGTPSKPVGTVCIAWAGPASLTRSGTYRFDGDREAVRAQSVATALQGLVKLLEDEA
ncbi:MAG: damage-inducible protein CinA [Betaproteobacteria bacterium RIFCSPLOWO2_12_FULL_66_14]|nr:MAG: damage-inducible protein CinA [Betaproteobacteria bacterium RIFCSPLOWO2_12_FULL_66_14]